MILSVLKTNKARGGLGSVEVITSVSANLDKSASAAGAVATMATNADTKTACMVFFFFLFNEKCKFPLSPFSSINHVM